MRPDPLARPRERDDFSSNRHPALVHWWSMIFSEKPVSTFRDHALTDQPDALSPLEKSRPGTAVRSAPEPADPSERTGAGTGGSESSKAGRRGLKALMSASGPRLGGTHCGLMTLNPVRLVKTYKKAPPSLGRSHLPRRHCEAPTGPREARPDDRLRAEAIQSQSSDAWIAWRREERRSQ